MLTEIANIYGTRLGNTAKAKEYADRAAAINPGQSILIVAYDAAGEKYDPSQYEDIFRNAAVNFDIKPEPDDEEPEEQLSAGVAITPNPANPSTTISYSIPDPSHVKLVIYSVSGQKIATLVDGHMPAGKHAVVFDGSPYASGVYFYKFTSENFEKSGKMVLVK